MDIGVKIRELRILNGLTQEELADRSELSKGCISRAGKRSHVAVYLHTGGYTPMPGSYYK